MQLSPDVIDPRAWFSGQCYPGPLLVSKQTACQEQFLLVQQQQLQQLASMLANAQIGWNACPHCGVWHFPSTCHQHALTQTIPSRLEVVREVFYPNEVWVLVRYSCGTQSIEEWGSASLLTEGGKSLGRALKDASDNAVENVLARTAAPSAPYTGPVTTTPTSPPSCEAALFRKANSSEALVSQAPPASRIVASVVSESSSTPLLDGISTSCPYLSPPDDGGFDTLDATRQSSSAQPQKASAEDSNGKSSSAHRSDRSLAPRNDRSSEPPRTKISRSVNFKTLPSGEMKDVALSTDNKGKPMFRPARRSSSVSKSAPPPDSLFTAGDASLYQSCPAISLQPLPDTDLLVADAAFKSVLVVDDDQINVKVLSRVLAKKGLEVTTGEDGRDIIELCIKQGKNFDLILVDENMRHMNGSTAVMELRRHEKEQRLQPMQVIVTSGNTSKNDLARYHSSGVNGVVAKPMNMRAMLKAINNYFGYISKTSSTSAGDSIDDQDGKASNLQDSGDNSPVTYSSKDTDRFVGNLMFGELEIFGRARK